MRMSVPANQPATGEIVRFGVFEVDLAAGEVRRGGERINIQELPFRALKVLISQPNEVLSREEFRPALWAEDVFVDFDAGVVTAIKRLRETLGDSATDPIFIETVGRRGYRWVAPLQRGPRNHDVPDEATSAAAQDRPAENPMPASGVARKAKPGKLLVVAMAILLVISAAGVYRLRARSSQNLPTVAARHPANHEAEELYLQGRFYWNKRTPESLNKAVDSFMQAIVHDPGYSQAYMGLADSYNLLREFSVMPSAEAYPRALAAAKKAVELDDQSSQAHASLAFVSFYGFWDAATADREFRRAIALDPNNGVAHHWYATYLMSLRRYSESLVEIERAQALDPTSNSILADKAMVLFNAGRVAEAVALFRQVEEADPNFVSPHRALAGVYLQTGDPAGYLVEARKSAVLLHDGPGLALVGAAQQAFAAGGSRALLQAMLLENKRLYEQGVVSPTAVAGIWVLLGDKQEALRYLEKAYKNHDDSLAEIEGGPTFHNLLHDEPGYRDLIAKIGLTPVL